MKDDTNIFNIVENNLVFNKEEARDIPEFKAIIIRDKGSEGDADGRKKKIAFKELMYIYLVCHPSSLYRALPDVKRKEKAKQHVGLPEKWKEDELIKEAKDAFIRGLNYSSLYYSYVNADRGVYSIGEDLNFFNNRRDKLRRSLDILYDKLLTIPEDEEHLEERVKLNERLELGIASLQALANNIMKLTNALPESFDKLASLKKQVANETNDGSELRGGGVLGNREE